MNSEQNSKCGCGCGARVPRQFATGHDSRLRVAVVEALMNDHPLRIYGQQLEPLAYADRFGIGKQVRETLVSRNIKRRKVSTLSNA